MPNVLIVDAQELFRDSLAALFERNGFNTCQATTAGQALAQFKTAKIDLIVMDVDLPVAQGLAFLQQLRQLPGGSGTPVFILTTIVDKTCIVRLKNMGVREYLLKQVLTSERLLERVGSVLGGSGSGSCAQPTAIAPAGIPGSTPVISKAMKATPVREQESPGRHAPAAVITKTVSVSHGKSKPPAASARPPSATSSPDPSQPPRLLTRDQTLELVDRIADGKTIAGVVSQVMAIANSPRADLTDLVRIIENDPILASRILQLSNSPAFASARGRVTTVEGAARNIGLKGIQNMALSVGIFGAFPPDENDGFNTMRCWQHSFAVADLMRLLGPEGDAAQDATHHLVGLCHDLGAILLRQHFTPHYEQILEFAAAHHLPLHAVESTALGIRHSELVARLLTHIGLPAPVVLAIREFCEREARGSAATVAPPARRLAAANQLAHGLLLAASTEDTVAPITRAEWKQIAAGGTVPSFDPVSKRNEIVSSTNILARLSAKDEQRMVMPIAPKSGLRLWYLRPDNFFELDPLALALSFTSELHVSSKFPNAGEWAGLDGMIIAGIRGGVAPLIGSDIVLACQEGGRPELPVLGLAAQGEELADHGHVSFGKLPVSLECLHQWMIGIEAAAESLHTPT